MRAPQNNVVYAIKFFASHSAFEDEKRLYLHDFPNFMPTVVQFVGNEDGSFRDPFNGYMPPCFVMEKGESLTERTVRMSCKKDIFTIIQACPGTDSRFTVLCVAVPCLAINGCSTLSCALLQHCAPQMPRRAFA